MKIKDEGWIYLKFEDKLFIEVKYYCYSLYSFFRKPIVILHSSQILLKI